MTKVYDKATDLITFARSSSATYLDSDGVLKTAVTDIPRIEYDGSDGSLKGLLIEEQRTNLVTYSEDNSQWYKAGSATLSDGTDGFTLGTFAAATAPRFATTDSTITMTAGQILTASWEIDTSQTDDLSNVDFYFGAKGGTRLKRSMTISGNAVTLAALSGSTSTYGSQNQFDPVQTGPTTWRISIVAENVSGVDQNVVCGFWDNDAALSRTIAVKNPQIEEGSFPTSYIPTSGSQSTRSADIAEIPVSAFGYNQTAGTVVVDYDSVAPNTVTNRRVFALVGNPVGNEQVSLYSGSGNLHHGFVIDDGAAISLPIGATGWTESQFYKSALTVDATDATISVDGAAAVTDPTGSMPTIDTLALGSEATNGNYLNGHIKSLSYFPRRLTDAQLQELTA